MFYYLKCFVIPFFIFSSCFSCVSNAALKESTLKGKFSNQQKELILNEGIDEPMRLYLTTSATDSTLLRTKSEYIKPNSKDEVLNHFVNRLLTTVQDSTNLGVGIAAPQVGVLKNIIWIQRFDKEEFPFEVYLNPKIIQYSTKTQPCPEGCLSIPNKRATTQNRSYAILIEYDDLNGKHHTEMVEDFTAVIFQHEIDHLNGILFTDHLIEEE